MKLMKLAKILIVLAFVSLVFSGIANAQTDMANGKHDLKAGLGTMPAGRDQGLCRFCHTPHNSNTVAPLWDRNSPATASFDVYASPTSQVMGQPLGISKGCLSCHDGITAFDSLTGLGTGTAGNTLALYIGSTAIMGADLSNDHPVGVTLAAVVGGEIESKSTIETGGLRLFGAGAADTVECASCHDPHKETYTDFLRLNPADGNLCETCHTK